MNKFNPTTSVFEKSSASAQLFCSTPRFFLTSRCIDRTDMQSPHRSSIMTRIGKLYFRYGTMGSAKTALLLTTAYNFEERGVAYMCLKPAVDTREEKNVIRSRIGIERECGWIYRETDLYALIAGIVESSQTPPAWILIDEAQFLSAAQVDQLARIVDDFA